MKRQIKKEILIDTGIINDTAKMHHGEKRAVMSVL